MRMITFVAVLLILLSKEKLKNLSNRRTVYARGTLARGLPLTGGWRSPPVLEARAVARPKSSKIAAETAARPPCPQLKPPQVAGRRPRRPRRGRLARRRVLDPPVPLVRARARGYDGVHGRVLARDLAARAFGGLSLIHI